MKSRLFLLFAFTCLSICATAQNYTVAGYVIGPGKTAVNDALVTIGISSTGTNSKGFFTIKTDLLPDVLTVSHPGFADKEEYINLPPLGNDTIFVRIQLEEKHTDLEEIKITAAHAIWVYPKKNVHILDFSFFGDDMVLLCKEHKNYLLRWVDPQNTPVSELVLTDHPLNLFRDCENQLNLIFSDSVFRISFRNDSLVLCDGLTIDETNQWLAPCIASIADKRIWRYRSDYGKALQFMISDTITGKKRNFYLAENRRYMRWVKEYEYDVAHGGKSMKDRNQNDYNDIQERMQAALERQRMVDFYTSRPAYVPAYVLRDSLVVFDHLNDTAFVYNARGQLSRVYPIIYQYHKNWDHQLLLNEEGTRIFTRFNYRGMTHLIEVNPNNGQLMGETILEEHIYPTKIQIKGDFVYYIYHFYIDNSINYVYKQHLNQ